MVALVVLIMALFLVCLIGLALIVSYGNPSGARFRWAAIVVGVAGLVAIGVLLLVDPTFALIG